MAGFKSLVTKKEANDISGLTRVRKERFNLLSDEERALVEGIACGKKLEAKPQFIKAECETIYEGENNQRIVLGRDRPHSTFSGYGGRGDSHASMIDIVAGAYGLHTREEDETGQITKIDPNFGVDAARVYISQKTDVDDNFGLRNGKVGNSKSKSAVGIKADAVRIVAREGIKLVTNTDANNSAGGNVVGTTGIDLIAGNDDSDMQPLVKGDNLILCLTRMTENISQINGMIVDILSMMAKLNAALGSHTHIGAGPFGPIVCAPSIELGIAVAESAINIGSTTLPSVISNKLNLMYQELQSLSGMPGGTSIISKHNHTN